MEDDGMMASQWKTYAALMVPANATPTEIAAIRHGFYAGAASIMIMNRGLCMEDVSVAEGKAMIACVNQELGEFFGGRPEAGVTH